MRNAQVHAPTLINPRRIVLHVERPIHGHCDVQRHHVANVTPVVAQRAQQRRLFLVVVIVVVDDDVVAIVSDIAAAAAALVVVVGDVSIIVDLVPVRVAAVRSVVLMHEAIGARRERNERRKRKCGAKYEGQLDTKRLSKHGRNEFTNQFADIEYKVKNRERLTQRSRLRVLIANKDLVVVYNIIIIFHFFIVVNESENAEK
jgi:hypothetical protein